MLPQVFSLQVDPLLCNLEFIRYCPEPGEKKPSFCFAGGSPGGRREIFYIYQREIKNARVPGDMLVLSVMTLSADLLRQIATDPHGFSRAHSIGNGLFNFPQGALPFPRYASLKRHPLLDSVWVG